MKKNFFLLPLFVFTLIFTSCNKDDDPKPTTAKINVSTTVEDYGAIAGVSITLYNASTDVAIATKISDADGKTKFENVTPNTYVIEADYTDSDDFDYYGDTNTFTVNAGDEKSVSISLQID